VILYDLRFCPTNLGPIVDISIRRTGLSHKSPCTTDHFAFIIDASMPEISLKPEVLFHLIDLQVTNTLLSTVLIFALLTAVFLTLTLTFNPLKPSKAQLVFEMIVEMLGQIFQDIAGYTHKASGLFSFVFSFFIFILISNWFGLLPFVGPFGIDETGHQDPQTTHELSIVGCIKERNCVWTPDFGVVQSEKFVPLFRAPTSDLSVTLALALLSVLVTNGLGIAAIGGKYLKKYISIASPIDFIVGILELISELGKIISFSFRLFGNVFAGEVLLAVIGFISYGLVTLPFIGLEFFVGMIQALVFFMLTTVFVSLAKSYHH
jgi:F-type H+-transporting ATPase subunit a